MSWIEVERATWDATDGHRSFSLRHGFADDPRLSHEAVSDLARRLPATSIEMNRGDLDPLHAVDGSVPLDRPAGEVARDIVSLQRWMAIKNIEQLEDYRAVVDEGLDDVDRQLELGPRMLAREGYVFLSAAQSVTPAHVDHEHNLLLQIRGTKRVTVGTFPDDASEQDVLEGMHSGRYGRTGFAPQDATTYVLEPGTGVYIPPRGVHLVENEGDLCLSLSLVFHTVGLERAARSYTVNAKLRRLGLRPRPPGVSSTSDAAKSGALRTWQAVRRKR